MKEKATKTPKIYTMSFGSVYPLYLKKVERKGRTQQELDTLIDWLTGYTKKKLDAVIKIGTTFETFFRDAPALNPSRKKITGVICGVRIEEIKDPLMREIRYLDKIIDELAKGRPLEKIKR